MLETGDALILVGKSNWERPHGKVDAGPIWKDCLKEVLK
jgi:hypothetical protein